MRIRILLRCFKITIFLSRLLFYYESSPVLRINLFPFVPKIVHFLLSLTMYIAKVVIFINEIFLSKNAPRFLLICLLCGNETAKLTGNKNFSGCLPLSRKEDSAAVVQRFIFGATPLFPAARRSTTALLQINCPSKLFRVL